MTRSATALATALCLALGSLPAGAQLRTPDTNAVYKVVWEFPSYPGDGVEPSYLLSANGDLYGTTWDGGTNGNGTIFRIRNGREATLYSFGPTGSTDGAHGGGTGSVIEVRGVLYGTTNYGGVFTPPCEAICGSGTLFSFDLASGAETILHDFGSTPNDGIGPDAPLTDVGSALYGTTQTGGAYGEGTVFSLSGGVYTVVHSFGQPGAQDGELPTSGLLNVQGTLYGVTLGGGADPLFPCFGTVYSIRDGVESVVHSFSQRAGDGCTPQGGLINVDGVLYGTTENGGKFGFGTIFAIERGVEKVVYDFTGAGDGANPITPLLDLGGTLYGATDLGGANGSGTVFGYKGGVVTVIYSFDNGAGNGSATPGRLVSIGQTLYGTNYLGGTNGGGLVYSLTP
jgi:uncharacterized repeat protein (TIGR03803 family)